MADLGRLSSEIYHLNDITTNLTTQFNDPVKGSDSVPYKLQKQFTEVFPRDILRPRTYQKDEDQTKSAELTVANLLSAAQNTNLSQMNSQGRYKSSYSSPTRHSSI